MSEKVGFGDYCQTRGRPSLAALRNTAKVCYRPQKRPAWERQGRAHKLFQKNPLRAKGSLSSISGVNSDPTRLAGFPITMFRFSCRRQSFDTPP
jgi:hypothetical protein